MGSVVVADRVMVVVEVHFTCVAGVHASEITSILATVVGSGVVHTLHFACGRSTGAAHFRECGTGDTLEAILRRRCGLEGRG
jgi:hypothetical protein